LKGGNAAVGTGNREIPICRFRLQFPISRYIVNFIIETGTEAFYETIQD